MPRRVMSRGLLDADWCLPPDVVSKLGLQVWPGDIFVGVVQASALTGFDPTVQNAVDSSDTVVGFFSDGSVKVGASTEPALDDFVFGPAPERIARGRIDGSVSIEVDLNLMTITMIAGDSRHALPLQSTPERIVCSLPMGKVLAATIELTTAPDLGYRGAVRPVIRATSLRSGWLKELRQTFGKCQSIGTSFLRSSTKPMIRSCSEL